MYHFWNQQNCTSTSHTLQTGANIGGELDVTTTWNGGQQLETAADTPMITANYISDQPWMQSRHLTPVRVDLSTVEQTAEWIRALSLANGWAEANQYSWSFYQNGILGHQLEKITLGSLKNDLGITKYGHRLAIVAAIGRMYPPRKREVRTFKVDTSNSCVTKSVFDSKNEEIESKPEQTPKPLRSEKDETSNHDLASCNELLTGEIITTNLSVSHGNKTKEFPNSWGEENSIKKSQKLDKGQAEKVSPAEVLSFSVRKKSIRARPDNPIKYKALRNAKIRSGKSVRSDTISYLTKGAVVVINQIKGRSGRVVVLHSNGEFKKIGWVTLYTHDRQQLMERLNYNRQSERMKMHMM